MLLRLNVPKRINHHASVAVDTALFLQAEFAQLLDEWLRIGKPVKSLGHRIGIATGPVIAAQYGASTVAAYTVIGKTVNKAARLCELARGRRRELPFAKRHPPKRASQDLGGRIKFTPLGEAQEGFQVEQMGYGTSETQQTH